MLINIDGTDVLARDIKQIGPIICTKTNTREYDFWLYKVNWGAGTPPERRPPMPDTLVITEYSFRVDMTEGRFVICKRLDRVIALEEIRAGVVKAWDYYSRRS